MSSSQSPQPPRRNRKGHTASELEQLREEIRRNNTAQAQALAGLAAQFESTRTLVIKLAQIFGVEIPKELLEHDQAA